MRELALEGDWETSEIWRGKEISEVLQESALEGDWETSEIWRGKESSEVFLETSEILRFGLRVDDGHRVRLEVHQQHQGVSPGK